MSAPRITFVGHATVLIEIAGVRLLTDPVLRPRLLGLIRRQAPAPAPGLTEDIDAVLLSHLHHDHLDLASLRHIGTETEVILPSRGESLLRRHGFARVRPVGVGEAVRLGEVEVSAIEADHDGRRLKLGPARESLGYVIAAAGVRIYFAGDTDLFDGMAELAGTLDVALLPIAGWGPRLGAGHLDPRTAAQAAAILRPRIAIPIHWGTLLRVGLAHRSDELLHEPAIRFAAQLAELAPGVEAAVLEPGESLELEATSSA